MQRKYIQAQVLGYHRWEFTSLKHEEKTNQRLGEDIYDTKPTASVQNVTPISLDKTTQEKDRALIGNSKVRNPTELINTQKDTQPH